MIENIIKDIEKQISDFYNKHDECVVLYGSDAIKIIEHIKQLEADAQRGQENENRTDH